MAKAPRELEAIQAHWEARIERSIRALVTRRSDNPAFHNTLQSLHLLDRTKRGCYKHKTFDNSRDTRFMVDTTRDAVVISGHPPHQRPTQLALAVGSIGVVYGDIGTSPLYA